MNIGIDFDNVIADSAALKIRRFKDLGYNVDKTNSSKHEFSKTYDAKTYEKIVSELYGSEATLRIRAISGAKAAIKSLSKRHQIYIITSRTDKESAYAKRWLHERMIPYAAFHNVSNKSKQPIIKKLNIHIFIDDELDKLKNINCKHKLLFDRPFNKHRKEPYTIRRVSSWQACLRHIASIAGRSNQR